MRPGLEALLQPGLAKKAERIQPFRPPRLARKAEAPVRPAPPAPEPAPPAPPPPVKEKEPAGPAATDARELRPVAVQYAGEAHAGSDDDTHVIAARNRRSRAQFSLEGALPGRWYELSFDITWSEAEAAGAVPDALRLSFDFLTGDGTSLDLAAVPGLSRARIDPFGIEVDGPAPGVGRRTVSMRAAFPVPRHAARIEAAVRGWRNTAAVVVSTPVLRLLPLPAAEAMADGSRPVTAKAEWERWALVPGQGLTLRGQVLCKEPAADQAFVRVVYRDGTGKALPSPYEGTLEAPSLGAYVGLPTDRTARRFTLRLAPPAAARQVELGFQAWGRAAIARLVPAEVSLDDALRLEALAGAGDFEPQALLARLAERFGIDAEGPQALLAAFVDQPALTEAPLIQSHISVWQAGGAGEVADGRFCLTGWEDFPLPEVADWQEDPFGCALWRARYHALSWLVPLAGGDGRKLLLAVDLAASWSRAVPQVDRDEDERFAPRPAATRVEALLQLLAHALAAPLAASRSVALLGEIVRHGFVLAEALGDNLIGEPRERLHAAGGLLALAVALPRLPLSAYWRGLALNHAEWSLSQVFAEGATLCEGSAHLHFEALAAGLALQGVLGRMPEAVEARRRMALPLARAIAASVALTDPDGRLTAFGEAVGSEHLPLLRDLIARFGREVMAEPGVAEMLAAQASMPRFVDARAGLASVRHREGADWGYFAACFGVPAAHGHDDGGSFVYAAKGTRWVVDPGGVNARGGEAAHHFRSAQAHNVLLPSGTGRGGVGQLVAEVALDGFSGLVIDGSFGSADLRHRRLFLLLDDLSGMAVFDRLEGVAEQEISAEGFLHMAAGVAGVLLTPQLALAFAGERRLQIVPQARSGALTGLTWICGRQDDGLQGFVAGPSGEKEPANVLRYTLRGKGRACAGIVLATGDEARARLMRAAGDAQVAGYLEAEMT